MNSHLTISKLQDSGNRITPVRRALVELFSDMSLPVTLEQINNVLENKNIYANKSTLYREIKFLLTNNYIVEITLSAKVLAYEASDLEHHHHLICDLCGSIANITHCLIHGLEDGVYKKEGFSITHHVLEFHGTCKKCLKKGLST